VIFQPKEPQFTSVKKEEYYGTMDKGAAVEDQAKEWSGEAGTGATPECAGTGESY